MEKQSRTKLADLGALSADQLGRVLGGAIDLGGNTVGDIGTVVAVGPTTCTGPTCRCGQIVDEGVDY